MKHDHATATALDQILQLRIICEDTRTQEGTQVTWSAQNGVDYGHHRNTLHRKQIKIIRAGTRASIKNRQTKGFKTCSERV